ncbi:MAG: flagellar biosynthetic protein FliO [Tissierellia bacterium]|nr:flagellar biosynthetic protein FliO [Tissierellia bacterium]
MTYYCTKWLSTKTSIAMSSRYMNVVDKLMLGQNNFIAIVEICSKYYLISITDKGVNILKELEEFHHLPDGKESSVKFNNILDKYKKTFNLRKQQ